MNQFIKCSFAIVLIAITFTSRAQGVTTLDSSNQLNMKGAYSMLRQVANDGTADSMMNSEQFKIYTDRYMLYVRPIAGDTLAAYGIGTYEIKEGQSHGVRFSQFYFWCCKRFL